MKTMRFSSTIAGAYLLLLALSSKWQHVVGRAILGVDLGSLYMKVALVQSGSPLEIVTNLHSKRKTEQMILFDRNQRFYGADAAALLARKSQQTPSVMSVMLGRDDQHPVVQVLAERHYPHKPVYNETRAGVVLTVDGEEFTPEELVAMVLSHSQDISVAYSSAQGQTIPPPSDVVLTVPAFATQHERRALLDAAALVDMNVLALIDENTAAAVHFAMDKTFQADEEDDKDAKSNETDKANATQTKERALGHGPELMIFYNMGASALQVSLIRFFSYEQPQKYGKPKSVPALEVLAKAWDETLGGQAFDHLIVEFLADEFNKSWRAAGGKADDDIRNFPRPMTKLRIQATKIKHVLSANTEIPVFMDSLHADIDLKTQVTRTILEELATDLLERAVKPIHKVLEIANKTMDDLTGIELIGGGMRIPSVQKKIKETAAEHLDLGLHINADESMALGAAFTGANISTAFRVRHVGMTDINPFPIAVELKDLPLAAGEEMKTTDEESEWSKRAVIFKSFGKMGVKKTIAFTHDRDVHCSLDYDDDEILPAGTEHALARYNISGVSEFAKEMSEKGLGKPKVSLQFELSLSGVTALTKAEASVEEVYTVQEEVEVEDDAEDGEEANATTTTNETSSDEPDNATDSSESAPEEDSVVGNETNATETTGNETATKKKKKTIMVDKEKKRTHRKTLAVQTYYVGRIQPHSPELMAASKAKLLELAERDKERMMLEEARNKVESYIYKIKNTIEDREEELAEVSTEEQRAEMAELSANAIEWLDDDGYNANLTVMEAKYDELSVPFEKILLRVTEKTARPAAVKELYKKLNETEELMKKWETSKPHITEEERDRVMEKVISIREWMEEQEAEQAKKEPFEEPAFVSTDVPLQTVKLDALVSKLSKKPKPKPEKKSNATSANETSTNDNTTTTVPMNETEAMDSQDETVGTDSNETAANSTEQETDDEL